MDFGEFVEIHAKQFCGDTEMAPEIETLREIDHAVVPIGILREKKVSQPFEKTQRDTRPKLTHSFSFWRRLTSTKAC